jgi:hypothetical protein
MRQDPGKQILSDQFSRALGDRCRSLESCISSGTRAGLICSEIFRAPRCMDETLPAENYSPLLIRDIVGGLFELPYTVWCCNNYGKKK